MGQAPDEQQLTHDIEETRRDLSRNVDALTDRVSPSRVVDRRVQATKGRLSSVKDSVFGSAHDATGSAQGAASSAGDTLSSLPGDTTTTVRRRTEGNPLAAGVVAFGVGWLVSTLLPASEKEQQAAQKLEDTAREHGQPVVDEAKKVGQDVGGQMKEKATDAAAQVKATATDSAGRVQSEGRSSATSVAEEARPGSSGGSGESSGSGI